MNLKFVVGEYVGGLLLILISWLFVMRFNNPKKLIKKVRERLKGGNEDDDNGVKTGNLKLNQELSGLSCEAVRDGVENGMEGCHYRFYHRRGSCGLCTGFIFSNH